MKLFESGKIGKLAIRNRIVMAAMRTGGLVEPDGRFSQRAIDYYIARAKGGTGLITTGVIMVSREVEPRLDAAILNSKLHLARLKELADAVHEHGAKIAVQLTAGFGRNIHPKTLKGAVPVAPSPVPCFWDPSVIARELTREEIKQLVKAFRFAAELARCAGIDAINIHAHDGYLFDEFMTALWNKRTDEYGGNLEGRLRFPLEAIEAVKTGAGSDFPIIFKLGLTHYFEGGREISEGLQIARRLEKAGVSAIEVDAGCYETRHWAIPPPTLPRGCLVNLAEQVKKVVNIPVITVGRLGYPELAETILQEGRADFIALGRTLLADPEWPNKVRERRLEDICPCIGDYEGCLVSRNKQLSCTVNPRTGMETEFTIDPAQTKKHVLVVGGGPAGMEAARVAALRGHKVTLWEKSNALGGNLIPTSVPDFKQDYRSLINFLSVQINKLGVSIKLGRQATPGLIQKLEPDVVFVATGSTPITPEIPGIDKDRVVTAIDFLVGRKQAGKRVVIIGGGFVGCETALYLVQQQKNVVIVEVLDRVARDMFIAARMHVLKLLDDTKVRILTGTTVLEITDNGVLISDKAGKCSTLEADTVVLACGFKPQKKLYEALKNRVPELYAIGDCVEPQKVINAIWDGFHAARVV